MNEIMSDDDEDDDDAPQTATAQAAPAKPKSDSFTFNLRDDPVPSFGALQQARADVFRSRSSVRRFEDVVDALGTTGEEGRRRGLGCWMLGRWDESAELLSAHESDDVASFTRGHALLSAGRPNDARPVFQRLSDSYPDEPRPRAGALEAQLEADLASGDENVEEVAAAALSKELKQAPASFHDTAEGHYVAARLAELERRFEDALDHFEAAIEADPGHRSALTRGAFLAERFGLDELALVHYQSLLALRPIGHRALMNLGVLYEDLGRDQDAAACYETVMRSVPTDPRARLYLHDAMAGMEMFYDEDLERKEDRLNQILRTPITDFELSVRARNCLSKMNIITLGDLVRKTEQELLSYKNFGETSLNEIKEILISKNLRLGMAHEEAVASIEAATRPRATGENAEILNRGLIDLELSIRARRTVENLGCLTIGDVIAHSEDELLGMPNFGQTSLQELKRKLSEMNLSLKAKEKKRRK